LKNMDPALAGGNEDQTRLLVVHLGIGAPADQESCRL
jgi:hypothetical protein